MAAKVAAMTHLLARFGLVLSLAFAGTTAMSDTLNIWAASSLKTALDDVVRLWSGDARIVYAGTSTLARQIEAGAPADVFISANVAWMDHLAAQGLIAPQDIETILTNSLVLVSPSAVTLDLTPPSLKDAIAQGRFAIPLTEAVPAGVYGREALAHLGLWPVVSSHLVETENVRKTLALVARGEVPLGLVYLTDALAEPKVQIAAHLPATSHSPVRYVVAKIGEASLASEFIAFLKSKEAQLQFEHHGFGVVR